MFAIRIAIARMRALFRRNATTDEIREELRFHVEMRTDEYARHGWRRERRDRPRCADSATSRSYKTAATTCEVEA